VQPVKNVTPNRFKFLLFSASIGLVLSVFLLFTQEIDVLFILSGAPFFLNSFSVNLPGLVNYVTFIYFILFFTFLGYLVSFPINRMSLMISIFMMVILHLTLVYFGGKLLFGDLWKVLEELSKEGISIK
jgi:hypothetical protein